MKRWLAGSLCAGIVAALQCVAGAASLRIVPIDPVPGGHVSSARPTIEFEIHTAGDAGVTRNEINVSLDGSDAGRDLQIVGSRLEIVPRSGLGVGSHHVDVSVQDNSGERAVDRWSFTVDAEDAAVPTVQDDSSASDDDAYDNGSGYAYGGGYDSGSYYGAGGYGAYGAPYGYYPGSGLFFPAGFGPYYFGEPISFIYTGFGLGGFVTIPGFPGTYPLVPFGPNYYFVTVPVPQSYNGGTPVAYCNFPHNRRRLLSTGPVKIEHIRRPAGSKPPAWVAPRWHPTLTSLATLPGTPRTLRQAIARHDFAAPQNRTDTAPRYYGTSAEPRMLRIAPSHTFSQPQIAQPRRMPLSPRAIPGAPHYAPVAAPHYAPVAAPHYAPVAAPHYAPVAAPHYAPVAAPHYAPVAAPVVRR